MNKPFAEEIRNHVSIVTWKMIMELVDRKKEEVRMKKAKIRLGIFLILCLLPAVVYLFGVRSFSMETLALSLENTYITIFIVLVVAGFVFMYRIHYKYEEAEDDYESLRLEILDRCEEPWSESDEWDNRDIVFEYLDREYDINLYYK